MSAAWCTNGDASLEVGTLQTAACSLHPATPIPIWAKLLPLHAPAFPEPHTHIHRLTPSSSPTRSCKRGKGQGKKRLVFFLVWAGAPHMWGYHVHIAWPEHTREHVRCPYTLLYRTSAMPTNGSASCRAGREEKKREDEREPGMEDEDTTPPYSLSGWAETRQRARKDVTASGLETNPQERQRVFQRAYTHKLHLHP